MALHLGRPIRQDGMTFVCQGCGKTTHGKRKDFLAHFAEHLRGRVHALSGQAMLAQNSACRKFLARESQGATRERAGYRVQLQEGAMRASAARRRRTLPPDLEHARAAIVRSEPAVPVSWPAALRRCHEAERDGVSGEALAGLILFVSKLPSVRGFLEAVPRTGQAAAKRFFAHVAYSVAALRELGGVPSATTLAVAVGDAVPLLDDVAPFGVLWDACQRVGLPPAAAVTWVTLAHDLVRPGTIRDLANIIIMERSFPDQEYCESVMDRLIRRHGLRKERRHDVFNLGATMPRAHLFAGGKVIAQKLQRWDDVQALANDIVHMVGEGTAYSNLARLIAAAALPGMTSQKAYWCNHLARLFVPGFAGIRLRGHVAIDAPGRKLLINMGEGAQALTILGITDDVTDDGLGRLCRVMEALARAVGQEITVNEAQAIVTACESHRRGGLTLDSNALCRRRGL